MPATVRTDVTANSSAISHPDKRAVVLELLERTEREPDILGATAHLLAIATR
jgi:hypothetical protein